MEWFVALFIVVFIFLLGWATGNTVEWILVSRKRRVLERDVADMLQRRMKERDCE